MQLGVPVWSTLNGAALVVAGVALFRFKLGTLPTLALTAVLGAAWVFLQR
ncbi:hypothetical protein ACMT4L_10045 [Deinococcus sp. A31D244]